MLRAVVAVGIALTVAACGSNIFSLTVDPPGKTPGYFAECLRDNHFLDGSPGSFKPSVVAARLAEGVVLRQSWPDGVSVSAPKSQPNMTFVTEASQIGTIASTHPGYVHLFLDCYIAHVDQSDHAGRLLRGQIMTALLAQYAAASVMAKESATMPNDAATIIFHIRRASIHLLSASPQGLEATYSLRSKAGSLQFDAEAAQALASYLELDLQNFRNAQRVAAVFDIGTDIAKIDGRYVANTAGTIFDVVSTTVATGGLNPSAIPKLQSLLAASVAGLTLAAQSQWYGSAFIRDAQESLLIKRSPANQLDPRVIVLWRAWQARINAACESLKVAADTRLKPCEPTAAEIIDYLKREYPDHPYLPVLKARAIQDIEDAMNRKS